MRSSVAVYSSAGTRYAITEAITTSAGRVVQRCRRALALRNISLKAARSNDAGMTDSRARSVVGLVTSV